MSEQKKKLMTKWIKTVDLRWITKIKQKNERNKIKRTKTKQKKDARNEKWIKTYEPKKPFFPKKQQARSAT